MAKSSRSAKISKHKSTVRKSRTTVSSPAKPEASRAGDIVAEKAAGTQDVASALPFNPNKAAEYDLDAALAPPKGASVTPADPIVGASTVSELNGSDKVGSGGPNIGQNPTAGALDRVRVDSTGRALTTNQGVPVADNQNSLKAGLRGPTLLEDFILREKITHFDHERIPERIVHARGSAAHGVFECTKAIPEFKRASLLGEVGKQTPVFVRFSTVLGERGSTDTARDVRPLGASDQLLTACGIETALPNGQPDPGVITTPDVSTASDGFIAAIAKHRHFARETDPPRV